ncbi:MAG: hypothetical protein ABL949_16130 [Fimbriimonadaceae bacterium]
MKTLLSLILIATVGAAMAQCQGSSCCAGKAKNAFGVAPFDQNDANYLAEAEKMMAGKSDCAGKMAGCPMEKMAKKSERPVYKLFVSGKGYEKFCCAKMAAQARLDHVAKGHTVGKVQKIASK